MKSSLSHHDNAGKRIIGLFAVVLLLLLPETVSALSAKDSRKFDYFYYEGLKLKEAGKYDAAFDAFNHALAIDSTASSVLYELSSFYVQLNRPETAVDYLRRAVNHSKNNFDYKVALATVARSLGMFTEAAEDYRQLVADYPDKPELNYYLADAYTQAGELGKAIDAYDALEDAIGASEALSMLKYKLYNQLNKPKEAYREIEKLSEKYPMDPHYQLVLGDLHLQRKEMKEAFACYQKAHDIDPNSPYYIVSMANYYEAAGDTEKAEEEIRSALNNDELDIDTKTDILQRFTLQLQQSKKDLDGVYALFGSLLEKHPENSDLRLLYGALLMSQNKIADAKYQYQVVTETTPDRAEGWQQLLNIALKSDSLNEVSRICKRCIELFPTSPEYYFYLGIVYYQQNNFQESLNTYKKGLTVVPADNIQLKSDFYGQMGDIYHQINLPDSAYAAYDEALKFNEQNVAVLNNYSYFLSLDKKDLKKAERMSAVCIKMEPNNATYLDTYAWIFFVQGSYSLAKIYIESALQKDTTHSSELVDHYGDILFMNGDKAKAVEQWKKAREMGKKSEVLDKKIASEAYIEDKNAK